MDLIKQREKRTIRRKIAKNKFDNMITLSANANNGIRLLDEGAVMADEETVWFWLEKGSLQRYLDNLSDDFVGYIKCSHNDFSNFPILLGSYSKSDLSLHDIGNDRKALYVKPHFFDTYLLKDIQAMPYSVGVSVEMNCWLDEDATKEMGFDVYHDLFISGFAVVGEAGNVNSSGVRLSGGNMALDLKAINEALETQSTIDLSALSEVLKKFEDKTEEEVELSAEESEEPAEEADEADEAEEAKEEQVDASINDVLEKVKDLTAKVEELTEENKNLASQIESLEADKTTLTEELSAKKEEERKFLERFKNLSVGTSDAKGTKEEPEVVEMSMPDVIGEL